MCFGGSSAPPDNSEAIAQQQIQAQQQLAAQNAEQQAEIAGMQADQAARALGFQEDQAAIAKQQADQQAAVQAQYDSQRNQLSQNISDWVTRTFGQYDDNYFNKYAQDYTNALTPEVDRQYGQASSQLLYNLAREGQVNSQAHADQQGLIDQTRGRAYSDIATQASQAAQALQSQVGQTKQNLLAQLLSTGALGQPIAPGTIDQANAAIDSTNRAINDVQLSGQDQIAKIGQLPATSSLGNIFGGIASAAGSFLSGNQAFNVGSAASTGSAGAGAGPTAPALR